MMSLTKSALCRFLLAASALATTGCAFLSKSEPFEPKYFTPESMAPPQTTLTSSSVPAARTIDRPPASLRLGRIAGSSYLKEMMVYRTSAHEIAFDDDHRWSERPEVYLRRAIEEAFFEQRGVRRVLSGSASPTLTADLIAFEELRETKPAVRVRIAFALHDDHAVVRERTLEIVRPLSKNGDASATAAALGGALREAVEAMSAELIPLLVAAPASREN